METKFNFNSAICTSRNKGGGVIKHHKIYALKGNELYEFDSVPEAAKKTGCWKDKIYKCCNGKLAYTGGYVWSYTPLDIPTEVEEWRDVKGYENLYQVSRKGKVRSSHKGYWEVLTSVVNRHGYNQYLFHKDGKRKNMRGNRLVAEAYIPNPDNLPFLNHKDENPANDCVDNLEWCTCEYNNNYGTLPERRSKFNPKNRPVCMFDVDGTFIREFYNVNDAAKYIGGNHPCVSRACSGQSITYKNKIWCYKGDEDIVLLKVQKHRDSNNFHRVEIVYPDKVVIHDTISSACKELGISRDTFRFNIGKQINGISWRKL